MTREQLKNIWPWIKTEINSEFPHPIIPLGLAIIIIGGIVAITSILGVK